jgi:hypothetical protein
MPFRYYFLGYAILRLNTFVCLIFFHNIQFKMTVYADFAFTIFESLLFLNFFKTVFVQPKILIAIALLQLLFLSLSIFLLISDVSLFHTIQVNTLQNLYVYQSILLLIPCSLYFTKIFLRMPRIVLQETPAFWITSGLSLFIVCTLPLSLILNYLEQTDPWTYSMLYSIFNIFYCFLFVIITRAFFCSPSAEDSQHHPETH